MKAHFDYQTSAMDKMQTDNIEMKAAFDKVRHLHSIGVMMLYVGLQIVVVMPYIGINMYHEGCRTLLLQAFMFLTHNTYSSADSS